MFSRTRLRISFLHCEVWNSGELLRFMTSLNYLKRVVPPDLGLSVAVPFSYHNGASHENSKGSIEFVEKFHSRFTYFFLNYNSVYVMCIGFHSGFIHLLWTVSNSVLYITNISIIIFNDFFYNILLYKCRRVLN